LYDAKYNVIIEELHRHDARIVSFEITTNSIDAKVDRILDRMEDNYPSAHKVQKQEISNTVSFHLIPDVIALPSTLRGTYHHDVLTIS
jgi:hypothetical protein